MQGGGEIGAYVVDVTPGLQGEFVLGGDGAARVVDVLRGGEGHGIAPHGAAQVVDGVGVDLHHFTAQDGAGVVQVCGVDVDTGAADEATARGDVTSAGLQIDLGYQGHRLGD